MSVQSPTVIFIEVPEVPRPVRIAVPDAKDIQP